MKHIMVLPSPVWLVVAVVLISTAVSKGEIPRVREGSGHSGPSVAWYDDLDSGWQAARQRGVPMVIFITSDRCHYCEAMKRDTWCDQSIRQRLADEFVAIRLTPAGNAKVLQRIEVAAYPTTLIGIPEGKIIDHRVGYQPPREMHRLLSKVRRR